MIPWRQLSYPAAESKSRPMACQTPEGMQKRMRSESARISGVCRERREHDKRSPEHDD